MAGLEFSINNMKARIRPGSGCWWCNSMWDTFLRSTLCVHTTMQAWSKNLWGAFPAPCWICAVKNYHSCEDKGESSPVPAGCICFCLFPIYKTHIMGSEQPPSYQVRASAGVWEHHLDKPHAAHYSTVNSDENRGNLLALLLYIYGSYEDFTGGKHHLSPFLFTGFLPTFIPTSSKGSCGGALTKLLGKHMLLVQLIWFRWGDLCTEPGRLGRLRFFFFQRVKSSIILEQMGLKVQLNLIIASMEYVMKEPWFEGKVMRRLFQLL